MTEEELNKQLLQACDDYDYNKVLEIIEKKADNPKNSYQWTALRRGIFTKSLEKIKHAVKALIQDESNE